MTTCLCELPLIADTYPVELLPLRWATARLTIQHANGAVIRRTEIIDLSHEPVKRYRHEPMKMIALKCFLLGVVGIPFYSLAYLAFHVIKLPIATLCNLSLITFAKGIWTLVRAPFYLIALEFAALYGIFQPVEGRGYFGDATVQFHQKSHHADWRTSDLPFSQIIWQSLSKEVAPFTFMAGLCMAPIGQEGDVITAIEILQPQA